MILPYRKRHLKVLPVALMMSELRAANDTEKMSWTSPQQHTEEWQQQAPTFSFRLYCCCVRYRHVTQLSIQVSSSLTFAETGSLGAVEVEYVNGGYRNPSTGVCPGCDTIYSKKIA